MKWQPIVSGVLAGHTGHLRGVSVQEVQRLRAKNDAVARRAEVRFQIGDRLIGVLVGEREIQRAFLAGTQGGGGRGQAHAGSIEGLRERTVGGDRFGLILTGIANDKVVREHDILAASRGEIHEEPVLTGGGEL